MADGWFAPPLAFPTDQKPHLNPDSILEKVEKSESIHFYFSNRHPQHLQPPLSPTTTALNLIPDGSPAESLLQDSLGEITETLSNLLVQSVPPLAPACTPVVTPIKLSFPQDFIFSNTTKPVSQLTLSLSSLAMDGDFGNASQYPGNIGQTSTQTVSGITADFASLFSTKPLNPSLSDLDEIMDAPDSNQPSNSPSSPSSYSSFSRLNRENNSSAKAAFEVMKLSMMTLSVSDATDTDFERDTTVESSSSIRGYFSPSFPRDMRLPRPRSSIKSPTSKSRNYIYEHPRRNAILCQFNQSPTTKRVGFVDTGGSALLPYIGDHDSRIRRRHPYYRPPSVADVSRALGKFQAEDTPEKKNPSGRIF